MLHMSTVGPKHSVQIAELYCPAAGGVADLMRSGVAEGNEAKLDEGRWRFSSSRESYYFENCTMTVANSQSFRLIHTYTECKRTETAPGYGRLVAWPYAEPETAWVEYRLSVSERFRRTPRRTFRSQASGRSS